MDKHREPGIAGVHSLKASTDQLQPEADLQGREYGMNWCIPFLHFGYVPDPSLGFPFDAGLLPDAEERERLAAVDTQGLIAQGVHFLKQAFLDTLAVAPHPTHVVPLSGGLDSRAILGGLLENVDRSRIVTITYGTPGTWDYDLGKMVAKAAKVPHECIDLTSRRWRWDHDELLSYAAACERPAEIFTGLINHRVTRSFGKECARWSGFLGDPLTGSHMPRSPSDNWKAAQERFVERNDMGRPVKLTPSSFKPDESVPPEPIVDRCLLTYEEQIDFAIRQRCYIEPLVMPAGQSSVAPFLHPDWVRFMLGLSSRHRQKQYLYREVIKRAYPALFSLPTKNDGGLPMDPAKRQRYIHRKYMRMRDRVVPVLPRRLRPAPKTTNYIDFDEGFRRRADLKAICHDSLADLGRREVFPWLNLDSIWSTHQQRRGNFGNALLVLTSLEIFLKAEEQRPEIGHRSRLPAGRGPWGEIRGIDRL